MSGSEIDAPYLALSHRRQPVLSLMVGFCKRE
jgi:hypothetical protein